MGERGNLEEAGLFDWDFSFFFVLLHPLCPPRVCDAEDGNDGWVGCAPESYTHRRLTHSCVPDGMWGSWDSPVVSPDQELPGPLTVLSLVAPVRALDHTISHVRAIPGMDRATSGGFARPGKALHSAPHLPRVTRAGGVC